MNLTTADWILVQWFERTSSVEGCCADAMVGEHNSTHRNFVAERWACRQGDAGRNRDRWCWEGPSAWEAFLTGEAFSSSECS